MTKSDYHIPFPKTRVECQNKLYIATTKKTLLRYSFPLWLHLLSAWQISVAILELVDRDLVAHNVVFCSEPWAALLENQEKNANGVLA